VRTVRCLGLCALSPALKIDGRSFGRVDIDRLPAILEQFA
jgi:NADH:ubiquinone oxidoreductase subunit E